MTIAEKRANEYYPKLNEQDDVAAWHGFIAGYEQAKKDMLKDAVEGEAEKDTIERAIAWLKEHANDYIVDLTPTYPDAPVNIVVGGKCWLDLKEYLEDGK